jgi:hypothetical protein
LLALNTEEDSSQILMNTMNVLWSDVGIARVCTAPDIDRSIVSLERRDRLSIDNDHGPRQQQATTSIK